MANSMPNVWVQMNYVAPRGQCNYRQSLLSPKCPCLRFMLHPLKSSSSYECDGCAHHASFHSMENKTEDEIRKRWEQEARDKAERDEDVRQRPKKRVRAIEYSKSNIVLDDSEPEMILEAATGSGWRKAKGIGPVVKKTARTPATRAKKSLTEMIEDDMVVELD